MKEKEFVLAINLNRPVIYAYVSPTLSHLVFTSPIHPSSKSNTKVWLSLFHASVNMVSSNYTYKPADSSKSASARGAYLRVHFKVHFHKASLVAKRKS